MGINKPSLYAQFKDKRRLFLAAIERYQTMVGGPNVQRVLDGQSVRETIHGYFAAINASLTASDTPPGCMLNSVAMDLAGRDAEIRARVTDLLVSTEDFLTERFEELGDSLTLPPRCPRS
ncbi:MAG: TetR/AcrR family transcriptional regulator [Pseudomonadota bacterium]